MTTTIITVDTDLIAKLDAYLGSLGSLGDCRTDNERIAHHTRFVKADGLRIQIRDLPDAIARVEARLAVVEADRAEWLEMQASLEKELLEAPDWRSAPNARVRDQQYDYEQHVQLKLRLLADGKLRKSPIAVYPTREYLDRRVVELTDQRHRFRASLDAAVSAATTLLAEQTTTSS